MELRNREQIEADFYGELQKLSRKHRQELAAHLGDPPNPDRVPASFWERVEKEREQQLAMILLL
ncbi:MAG: hypothetical protein ACF8CY_02145, partial [Gimesia chilikensis]